MKFAPHLRAAALLTAVALLPATTAGYAQVDGAVSPEFAKFFATYQRIKTSYVEPVDDETLIRGAIDGMLAALDPHSAYLEGSSFERLTTMIDGNYQGLGISVQMAEGMVKVVSPFKGSPADKAGIKAGDYISHIDGKLIYGFELDDAVAQMRGPAGSSIRLSIIRAGRDAPFDVTVTRGVIELEPVTHELKDGNVGYISVNEFSRDVGADVAAELVDRDVADVAVLQLMGHRLELDDATRDGDVERRVATGTDDRQTDRTAGGPAHLRHGVIELEPVDQLAVDVADVVARLDPGLVRGAALERRHDFHHSFGHLHRDAEALVVAVDHRRQPLEAGAFEIGGVRVERGEHAVDRAANQRLVVDRLDIARLDPLVGGEELGEFGRDRAVDLGIAGGRGRQQRDGGQQRGGAQVRGELHRRISSCIRQAFYRAPRVNAR